MMMMMTFVSQLLWTVIGIIIYVSSTSFLNQPFVYRAIVSSFVSVVCTKGALTLNNGSANVRS